MRVGRQWCRRDLSWLPDYIHFSFSTFVIGHEFPAPGLERPVDQLTGHRPSFVRLGVVAIATNTQPVPFLQVATIGLQFVDQSLRHYQVKYPIHNSQQWSN
ncbi:hypothetical protein QE152_g25024 [Popillia japonica]|uniref:Uncharacterized protein n=1 Tax=Popillia japonica TaxID=7064 RepID=A0AAW1K2U6_POPJA